MPFRFRSVFVRHEVYDLDTGPLTSFSSLLARGLPGNVKQGGFSCSQYPVGHVLAAAG